MTQVKLAKIRLKKGGEQTWFDWCKELKKRKNEVLETLKNEGVLSESCFLSEDENSVYYFIETENFENAKAAAESSNLKIDAEHKKKRNGSFEEVLELKELFHFENRS